MKNRIREVREALGVPQSLLAARSGMSQQSLCRAESGRGDASESTIRRVASALGCRPSQLLDPQVLRALHDEIQVRHLLVLEEARYWDAPLAEVRPANPLDNVLARTS